MEKLSTDAILRRVVVYPRKYCTMKQSLCATVVLVLSIADNVVTSVRAQQTSPCDTDMISFCEQESN
jgi:hypothetical protein